MFKNSCKWSSLAFGLTLLLNAARSSKAAEDIGLGTRKEEEILIHDSCTRDEEILINDSCKGSVHSPATYGCSLHLLQLIDDPRVALDLRVKALIHLGVKCRNGLVSTEECLRVNQELEKIPTVPRFAFPFKKFFVSLTRDKFSKPSVGGPFDLCIIEASADHGGRRRK